MADVFAVLPKKQKQSPKQNPSLNKKQNSQNQKTKPQTLKPVSKKLKYQISLPQTTLLQKTV